MKKNQKNQQRIVIIVVGFLIPSIMWSPVSYALGMGAATTESYIGQRLSVHIPLFNVNVPDDLSVILQRTQNDGLFNNSLGAQIERKNSQLGIRVSSKGVTNEPFVSFIIEVLDGGSVTSKEFTVLLDLPASQVIASSSASSSDIFVSGASNNNFANQASSNSSVMGPYDWAVAGQVPQTFGPVLDGQSLWRVARRMNKALNVSIDQMMWSLYQNNRAQFSTDSITSLKAGAFLKIPSVQQASQISELVAKRNVEQLAGSTGSTAVPNSKQETKLIKEQVSDSSQSVSKNDSDSSFELTGLDLTLKGNGNLSGIDGKSQEIISSLAESVGNLTQELIKKDQKISFLEEKIDALEEYAQVSASELTTEVVPELNDVNIQEVLKTVEFNSPPSGFFDNKALTDNVVEIDEELEKRSLGANKIVSAPLTELGDSTYQYKWWYGLLLVLALLSFSIFLLREWLVGLVQSLNLFQKNNEIEFNPTEYQQANKKQKKVTVDKLDVEEKAFDELVPEEMAFDEVDPDMTVENKLKLNGLSQKSILDSMKNDVEVDDALSPQTLIDLDGDFSYSEMYSDDVFHEDDDEVGLSFFERFNNALTKQDFGFALQLLNMAKGNEIDQAVYHSQRLRIYESMHDENAFYDYFCEIEDQIPSFEKDIQKQISQLVLEMAEQ